MPVLIRLAPFFRIGGWLIAAIGVIGLVKSVGGLTLDYYLEAVDTFRAALGAPTDPTLAQVLDGLRQILQAAKPTLESAARTPPFSQILLGLGGILPQAAGSAFALGLGIVLHQFGARIQQGRL